MTLNAVDRKTLRLAILGIGLFPRAVARMAFVVVMAVAVSVLPMNVASAYTPEDATVRGMVDRGIAYLEGLDVAQYGRRGERVIVAYAHHKCRHDPDVPLVKRGITEALEIAEAIDSGAEISNAKRVYLMAVCIMLFADVDPDLYKPQLVMLQRNLFEVQYSNGGWGYPNEHEGDISQVQYALLATWTLDRMGIPLEYARVVNVAQWLLRVQDPSGGWPYHGKDPGPGNPLTKQTEVTMSMSLAGGSSLLIAGDALRIWGESADDTDPEVVGLPKAIKLYKEDTNVRRRKRATISEEPIRRSIGGMDRWRNANPYKRTAQLDWYYYQLYTLERFESFIEIANGSVKNKSPAWYNSGVDELRKFQGPEGGWVDRSYTSGPLSTSFALLFLIRSTQKAVFNISSGETGGGRGLPGDTTNIRVDGTQIKGQPVAADISSMLEILEQDAGDDVEGKSLPENLALDKNPGARAAQLDRLERLVRGSQSYQARRVAARLLGTSDELRVVPALIFSLSDTDPMVWQYARDGLRFLSRKFDGMGLDKPPAGQQIHSPADIDDAQKKWRAWYRTMNPKYVFLDYDL